MQRPKEILSVSGAGKGVAVFVTWTLTSFICHYAAKQFLSTSKEMWGEDTAIYGVLMLTFTQIFTCFSLLRIPFLSSFGTENDRRDCLCVAVISHVMATMATNHSMTLMHADSTFAIKLMEPITSAVMSMLVIGTTLSLKAWCSLPLIVCGAVGFIGNPFTNMNIGYGAWYAVISNVILAIRNLGIKFLNKEKTFTFRSYRTVGAYYVITVLIGAVVLLSIPGNSSLVFSYVCLFVSATFHVIYSFVSTGIVLQYLSVVSHSVANIWKRILVVLLLYFVGTRQASSTNVLFLLLCIVGLLAYVYGQSAGKVSPDKDVTTQSRKRLTSALVIAIICVVLFNGSIPLRGVEFRGIRILAPFHGSDGIKAIPKEPLRGLLAYDHEEDTVAMPRQSLSQSKIYQDPKVKEFLSWNLADHSNETDFLASRLTSSDEVIRETQRVTLEVSTAVFGSYKFAFLLDMANFENKGDPAINMGELRLLRAMRIEVLFNCHYGNCTDKALTRAKTISNRFRFDEIVILCSGGGNMGGYPINDHLRYKIFKKFPDHKIVVFPQSTWFHDPKHFNFSKTIYSMHNNLTIMLRDRVSLDFVRRNFPKPKTYLVPDAALFIGPVARFMPPVYDIIWLRRADGESTKYKMPALPNNISLMVSDWWHFKSPSGKNVMENTFLFTTTGLMFVQRGRVLITDRLHGHILAVLLNIPHVIIDNKIKKITNFRNSWTASVENVRLASDPAEALLKALELISLYGDKLAAPVAYMGSEPR